MPEIARFFGIVIRMYYLDHDPPHFHAIHAGREALLRIAPFGLMSGDVSSRNLALLRDWATLNEAALLDNWLRLRSDIPPQPIPPLE